MVALKRDDLLKMKKCSLNDNRSMQPAFLRLSLHVSRSSTR